MQYPIGEADLFRGVYDLAMMEEIIFGGKFGENMEKKKISKDHPKFKELLGHRMKLIEQIGNYNEEIGDMYLNEK
jgi:hypothetical protein